MNKNVLLNIRSDYNGEETLNILCDGKFSEKNGGFEISWDGSEVMGEDGEKNVVEIYGENTFVFRLGDGGDLILENGKTCAVSELDADTMKSIPVQFFITEFKNELSSLGGKVTLGYSISNPYTGSVRKRLEIWVM